MPVTGRSLFDAAEQFRDHVNHVLFQTVTQTPMQLLEVRHGVQLGFRQAGRPIRAPLATRMGAMGLYLGQVCGSVVEADGRHRLFTQRYTYSLTPDGADDPILRWEYIRDPGDGAIWCRHHVQGPIAIRLNRHDTTLNHLHLPTGYVPFEEILRFCIVDLEVPYLTGAWDAVLTRSYRDFRTDLGT